MIISDLSYLESMPEAFSILGGDVERTITTTTITSSSDGDKKLSKKEAEELAKKLGSLGEILESSKVFGSLEKLF
jgi:hypothetical protein